jgi:hypothetical protein
MPFYKHDLICAGSVYFLQGSLWYFSFQYRVGGLLRRRHEITFSRIIRKSGIYRISCGDLVFSLDFSEIQLFCLVNEDRQAVPKEGRGAGGEKLIAVNAYLTRLCSSLMHDIAGIRSH